MAGNNSCHLVGNLGKDAEVKYSQEGTAILTLSLAVRGFNNTTAWFRCVAFGTIAERLMKLQLLTGTLVAIEGSLSPQEWVDQTTQRKQYSVDIRIGDLTALSRPQPRTEAQVAAAATPRRAVAATSGSPKPPYMQQTAPAEEPEEVYTGSGDSTEYYDEDEAFDAMKSPAPVSQAQTATKTRTPGSATKRPY